MTETTFSNRSLARPAAPTRLQRVAGFGMTEQVDWLVAVAKHGMGAGYVPESGEFVQTLRAVAGSNGVRITLEGSNLRYAAMATLGIGRLSPGVQRHLLGDQSARAMAVNIESLARHVADPGAVALAAWAAAELAGRFAAPLFARLEALLAATDPLPTVDVAWMLTAAVAAADLGDTANVTEGALTRLLAEQGNAGIFPHLLPSRTQERWRRHVGSFADQVYPIQALARYFARTGDARALAAAERTAQQVCACQGGAGQWWWHYDVRTGAVIERFPVYSVHQHAMAPMALFDLAEAGGTDRTAHIVLGLRWLHTHPEIVEELISPRFGLIWRKVGRHEPSKAGRRLSAATTALRPGLRLPGLDRLLPPGAVDHECRPYELGWLLYAWLPARGDADE